MAVKVSPFNPKIVTVIEERDPTCLLYICGEPMRIVGRAQTNKPRCVAIKTETGIEYPYTQPVPIVLVERKD